jgi:DNA helicase HerA-like ATPase
MVNPADQRYVRNTVESLGEDEAEILPDLEQGEAIFAGQFVNFPVLAKGKPPRSRSERDGQEDESAFDKLERIENESE